MESNVLSGDSAKGHILFGIKAKSHVLYGDCLELVHKGRALSGVSSKSNVLFGGSGNPEPLATPSHGLARPMGLGKVSYCLP